MFEPPMKDFNEELAAMSMRDDTDAGCQYMQECRVFVESLELQGTVIISLIDVFIFSFTS